MKEKVCSKATMFDINKTIMRCLVKNIAMFGLGLYLYAGEDLPDTLPLLVINSNLWNKAVDKKMSLEELAKHVTIPNDTAIKYKESIK